MNLIVNNKRNVEILFIRNAYSIYWKAYVNNRETKIFPALDIFQSIILPPGKSTIRFEFKPPFITIELLLAYIIIILTLLKVCSLSINAAHAINKVL